MARADFRNLRTAVITRNLMVLSLVSLLNDFSTDMAFPILIPFLTSMGASAALIGTMEGAADSVAAFLRYTSGRISDRIGRRKILTFSGYGLSSLVKAFYGFTTHAWQVVTIRVSDRVGKGFREAPRDAIIAESIPHAYWGFGYGFHRMMDTTGALLGPLVALVLLHFLGTTTHAFRQIFFVAAVPGLLGMLLVLLVKETGKGPSLNRKPAPLVPQAALHGPLARFLFVMALFTVGNLSIAFLILRAADVGVSPVNIIFLYVVFNAVEAVASLPTGALTDRIGRAPLIAMSFTTFALLYAGVVLFEPSRLLTLMPFFVLNGVAKAFREGQGRAFVADLAPKDMRATGFGAYHATIGFLALPAGLLAGSLWEISYRWTFLVAMGFCVAALGLFLYNWTLGRFARREDDPQQDEGSAHVH